MENRELALIGRLDGPQAVPMQTVTLCKSYRDAVRMAWRLRRVAGMTKAMLAHFAGLTPQHVSDYLAEDDNSGRRDLPADAICRFESAVGNTLVSQWVARQSQLTVLEEMQATRAAA
jgi:predicted transcriptional regulator